MRNYKATKFGREFALLVEESLDINLAREIESNLDGAPGPKSKRGIEAMEDTLDPGVSAEDYLTDPEADKALQQQIDARNQEIASVIEGWVDKIEAFTEFLNGTSDSSLQSILAKAQPGTLFAKVQANTNRKLANCATELASISETFKSFIGQKAITTT